MLRFRALLSVLTLVLIAGGWLLGQEPKTSAKGRALPLYWKSLGLSDEQKQKAMAVVSKYRTEIDDLKKKISQLETEEKAELAKLLTADQKKQLQKIIASKVPGSEDDKKEDKKP